MAKHKRNSNASKKFKSGAVLATTVPVLAFSGASPAMAQPSSAWDAIIDCESGGRNVENGSSTASGYFQIIDGTWKGAGGLEFAPRAIDATPEQQAIVAQRIAERRGSLADWNASKGCWGDDISSAVPSGPAALGIQQAPPPAPVVPPVTPPAPPAPVVETAPVVPEPVAPANTYTVVEGDWLTAIGSKLGIAWEEIAALNNIPEPYILHPGQVLQLPSVQVVVEQGDTLSEIAVDLGMPSWEPIYEQNKDVIGDDPNLIYPQQVFFVGGLLLDRSPVAITKTEEAPAQVVEPTTGVVSEYYSPIEGGKITSPYGPRGSEFHNGIDIDGIKGVTKIHAPVAGQVVAAECGVQGFECWVRVKDLDGNVHTFGHMNDMNNVFVQEGQWVEAGTHLANVGNGGIVSSGTGDGSHLHYRITMGEGNDALPINPEHWLADRGIVLPHA